MNQVNKIFSASIYIEYKTLWRDRTIKFCLSNLMNTFMNSDKGKQNLEILGVLSPLFVLFLYLSSSISLI